jgi:hypothetical protein
MDPAPTFRRPGWYDEPHLFCPRCRHPLLRWDAYWNQPETMQVVWDPDRWLLPVPWQGLMIFAVLVWLVPWLPLASGRRGGRALYALIIFLGFIWAAVSAWLEWRGRLRRRAALEQTLGPHDWVCVKCLHSQPEQAGT